MQPAKPPLVLGRHFEPTIIVTCVRWYLRLSLSLRNIEELMAERGLIVDHTTVWRWCQRYGPELHRRLKGQLRYKRTTWYLFRAVDSRGETVDFYLSERRDRESAKAFLEKALSSPENQSPRVLGMDKSPIYPAAIRELKAEGRLDKHCRLRRWRYCNNRIESDHRQVKRRLRAMQGPRTLRPARRVVKGIEAVHMIRKGQILGITRRNLSAHAMVFGFILGVA